MDIYVVSRKDGAAHGVREGRIYCASFTSG